MTTGNDETEDSPAGLAAAGLIIQRDYRTNPPRHKPISFVAAQSADAEARTVSTKSSISNSYLSLVLPSSASPAASPPSASSNDHQQHTPEIAGQPSSSSSSSSSSASATLICEACNLPFSTAQAKQHHTSTAHQASLPHTHVPSALDRTRKGMHYLQSYGWDPDARTGLGSAHRPGVLHPIKPKEKVDRSGIGVVPREEVMPRERQAAKKQRVVMGVKEIRGAARTERKRHERLQRMFYSDGEVEKYLGADA